jgi:hypothetical protein
VSPSGVDYLVGGGTILYYYEEECDSGYKEYIVQGPDGSDPPQYLTVGGIKIRCNKCPG